MEPNDRPNMGADAQARAIAERNARNAGPAKLRARAAKPAEIVADTAVVDAYGVAVGKVRIIDAGGAIVTTPVGEVDVPLEAFGKAGKNLVVGMTKAEFDALVVKANRR